MRKPTPLFYVSCALWMCGLLTMLVSAVLGHVADWYFLMGGVAIGVGYFLDTINDNT